MNKKTINMSKKAKRPTKLDKAAIIQRGYATDEEYTTMGDSDGLEKLNLVDAEGWQEGIWIYALEDSGVKDKKFHFVFFNDPLAFMAGPRPAAGLVGIATSHGSTVRATALTSDCLTLFQRAGQAAIDYAWKNAKEEAINSL